MKCLKSCDNAVAIWTSNSDTLQLQVQIQAAIHKCKPFGAMIPWALLETWLNVSKASF